MFMKSKVWVITLVLFVTDDVSSINWFRRRNITDMISGTIVVHVEYWGFLAEQCPMSGAYLSPCFSQDYLGYVFVYYSWFKNQEGFYFNFLNITLSKKKSTLQAVLAKMTPLSLLYFHTVVLYRILHVTLFQNDYSVSTFIGTVI